jgi:DNA polymerase-4
VAAGRDAVNLLCRDCRALALERGRLARGSVCGRDGRAPDREPRRCPKCGSPRIVRHAEIATLAIAHIDCDAFYATVEKRGRPELADRPVIIGGGRRGVVLACCYVARLYGVRSAMPMFEALAKCREAVVIAPDMAKYREVGRMVRVLMRQLTPLVEPLSIDEAFLDLGGGSGGVPAQLLAGLAARIENELGITVSIGLSDSKFLAKIASDLDKPRGFAVLSRADAPAFLADKPVSLLWGVGAGLGRRRAGDGITRIGQLAALGAAELAGRYGQIGTRLARLARGEDDRAVLSHARTRSISAETTFVRAQADQESLARALHPLCEQVAARLREAGLAAGAVTVKLKTADFRLRTRSRRLADPTQLADTLFAAAVLLLAAEADGVTRFRLVGIGADALVGATAADLPTLFDRKEGQPMDAVRTRQ